MCLKFVKLLSQVTLKMEKIINYYQKALGINNTGQKATFFGMTLVEQIIRYKREAELGGE